MTSLHPLWRRTFDAPCTIEIEHTAESLHAHVAFDQDFDVRPGDEVRVHEAPTDVSFGDKVVFSSMATVVQAGLLERIWVKFASWFEMAELYEVSFTDRRSL